MSIQTESAIAATALSVRVEIGIQKFSSETFYIEVFDCRPRITLPTLKERYTYQVDAKIPRIQAQAFSDSEDCKIENHKLNDTVSGIAINEATGQITMKNEAEIAEVSFEGVIKVGS